jgi:hypothetical protein
MKKLLIPILLMSIQLAYADAIEINKKVVCDKTKLIMDTLITEYKEIPLWSGSDEKSNFGLLINKETGTWTIIQFNKDTTCILGVGENSRELKFSKSEKQYK